MAEKQASPKKLSAANTKQEMLEAYQQVLKELQAKREVEVKPEEKVEERAVKKVVETADALASDGVVPKIGELRSSVVRMLAQLSDKLEDEAGKYESIKKAIEAKDQELHEIYEIQRAASSLAALIETQQRKRQDFEDDMAQRKEELTREIQTARADWDKEKRQRESEIKERDTAEGKRREREKEEYRYAFAREQQLAKDQFADETARLERELATKRTAMEKDLLERERAIAARETEFNEHRQRAAAFPKELEAAVQKAVKETTERLRLDAANREELFKKEFAGERNVLTTRIASLEQTGKEQSEQLARFAQQADKAYSQVQEIAVRAIEGSANLKSATNLQQMLVDQVRKTPTEK